ncbi:MAG: hypothetical protein ACOCRX_07265 [Candidatus Woesearchaeota archaeon]
MNIEISLNNKRRRIKEKVERDLYWYDNIKQKMCHFKGGQLRYEYKFDNYLKDNNYHNPYRLLPVVEDLEVVKYKMDSDYDGIIYWVNNNNFNIDIITENDRSIEISINDDDKEDIIDELEQKRFNYMIL